MVVVSLGATTATHAGLIATLIGNPQPFAGNFAYNYNIGFGTGPVPERLNPGDFITLYDVAGPLSPLVGAPTAPAGFTTSVNLAGATPPGTAPFDSPLLSNVTWTYTGPPVTSDTLFGPFQIVTTQSAVVNVGFTSQTTNAPPGGTESPLGHIGTTRGPLGIIPEPGTVALLGAGALAGLIIFRRARRT